MKYLSLFSGIGGFELGIQQAYEEKNLGSINSQQCRKITNNERTRNKPYTNRSDWKRGRQSSTCIGYSEIDKYAIQIYQKHFPKHKNYGDITKITAKELPNFDLVIGGFPCQSFSIAGKRLGFNDTRGTLFFDIARIVKEKRPKYLLLENVKGLLSHDNGRTFRVILSTLNELRYDIQWQVLNSKNFGVPQNRERVFIIGYLRGESRPKVFPIGESDKISDKKQMETTACISALTKTDYKGASKQRPNLIIPVISRPHGFNKGGKRKYPNVRESAIQNELVGGIRRLTPTECERLQGFPDGWTEGMSDTQRYKTLGNAVTVNVIREIMKRLEPTL